MSLKTYTNYSPNFTPIKRNKKKIKFIIFHYTGMKKETDAIKRLTDIKSEVSSHYLIKDSGKIIRLVPDLYIAWHAGVSSWKNYKYLNKDSIGIEITNQGHELKYKNFSKKQINSIIKLSKFLINKFKIKPQDILGHSDIALDRKKDPGEKFPWKYLSQKKIGYWHNIDRKKLIKNRLLKTSDLERKLFFKNLSIIGYSSKVPYNSNFTKIRNMKLATKAFQRRFRQELINGIVDKECLFISENIAKKLN